MVVHPSGRETINLSSGRGCGGREMDHAYTLRLAHSLQRRWPGGRNATLPFSFSSPLGNFSKLKDIASQPPLQVPALPYSPQARLSFIIGESARTNAPYFERERGGLSLAAALSSIKHAPLRAEGGRET